MRSIKVIFVICCILSFKSYSQHIILIYDVNNNNNHPTKTYYWLTSMNESDSLYPVYFDGFSKDNLERCIDKNEINLFVSSTSTNWDFETSYIEMLGSLVSKIESTKKLFRKMKIKGDNGVTKVKLYYALLNADFSRCRIYSESGNMINYQGDIFLPVSMKEDSYKVDYNKVEELLNKRDLFLMQIENKL